MKKGRVKKANISLIAVDVGPGSFTGVRIGVSAARSLAQALNIPVIGINALECLAHQSNFNAATVAALIPALPREYYLAAYSKKGNGEMRDVIPVTWKSEAEVVAELQRLKKKDECDVIVHDLQKTGDLQKIPGLHWITENAIPHPQTLAHLGVQRFLKGKVAQFSYENVIPLYLQPSWAERSARKPV
jgi:tRNA threonylcarbamoyladenosine biosynthesis protein TsaB